MSSGSRFENDKETENFLEIYIWNDNDSYLEDAKENLVKLSPAVTWKIKIIPHQLVVFGKIVYKQNVNSGRWRLLVAYISTKKR